MKKTSVLVIEDNAEVRENLVEILELYGYVARSEPNGIAGVKAAVESPPDIILCDVMMPELDGYGVLNLLAENERTAGVPFIFITARTEKEDIRRGMNLGADDYITKPFYKDELLAVIKTRLKKAAARGSSASPTVHLSDPEGGRKRLDEAFVAAGRKLTAAAGHHLVREGDHAHFIYRVVSGHVHLTRTHEYGRDYVIAELSAGEIFGLPAVLERTPYPYTARVVGGDAEVTALPATDLLKLLNTDRSVTEALMRLLAGRVAEQSDRLLHQAYDSVRRRTALTLCDLHEKYDGEPILLSREELAQLVGATKESVIRSLSDFKRDGLVETTGKEIVLPDVDGLRRLLV